MQGAGYQDGGVDKDLEGARAGECHHRVVELVQDARHLTGVCV